MKKFEYTGTTPIQVDAGGRFFFAQKGTVFVVEDNVDLSTVTVLKDGEHVKVPAADFAKA